MKKLIGFSVCLFLLATASYAQEHIIFKNPLVITGKLVKETGAIKNFKKSASPIADIIVRDEDGVIGEKEEMEEMPELPRFKTRVFKGDASLQKVYPNLVKNNAFATVYIESLNGAIMLNKSIPVNAGRNIYQVDVSRFTNGVYFIKLASNNEVKIQKIIVAK